MRTNISAFTCGTQEAGRKEVEKIWRRSKKVETPPTKEDFERWEREINGLPAFSLLLDQPSYLTVLDTNPNI